MRGNYRENSEKNEDNHSENRQKWVPFEKASVKKQRAALKRCA